MVFYLIGRKIFYLFKHLLSVHFESLSYLIRFPRDFKTPRHSQTYAGALYCLLAQTVCSFVADSQTRADALHCLLTQTVCSFVADSQTRANALHCLLAQTVCSLRACKKQMPPLVALVFSCAPYMFPIILSFIMDAHSRTHKWIKSTGSDCALIP